MSGRSTKRVRKKADKEGLPDAIIDELEPTTIMKGLEEEAASFTKARTSKKSLDKKEESLTPRQIVASLALAGLLARSQGLVSKGDLRREAYEWADFMLQIG